MVLVALGILSLLGGVLLLGTALYLYLKQRSFLQHAREVAGVVVGVVRGTSSEGVAVDYPVVQFRAEGGELIEFEHRVGSNLPLYRVGQEVPVLYDPERPGRATIRSFTSLWLFCIVTTLLGVIATCGASPLFLALAALLPAR